MRLPIQCALAYPDRMPKPPMKTLNLAEIGSLTFGAPDLKRFPCLQHAMDAGREGGTLPAAMAAADEVAVARFMAGEIKFLDIATIIGRVMQKHRSVDDPSLEAVLEADAWARAAANDELAEVRA